MAMPLFSAIRVESGSSDSIAHLVLDRPDSLNALSRVLLTELIEACRWLDDQHHIKVVVVRGEGRAFSAGFDLGDFTTPSEEMSVRDTAGGRHVARGPVVYVQVTEGARFQGTVQLNPRSRLIASERSPVAV